MASSDNVLVAVTRTPSVNNQYYSFCPDRSVIGMGKTHEDAVDDIKVLIDHHVSEERTSRWKVWYRRLGFWLYERSMGNVVVRLSP